jgi:serine/threonine-protein kinase
LTTLDSENKEEAHYWPQIVPGGRAIFTVLRGGRSADEGSIEAVDLETGERTVLHSGGAYGRWVPSGHLVYLRESTLFAMPFDIDTLDATGVPSPIVQGVTNHTDNGGAQYDFSQSGHLAYVSGVVGTPEFPVFGVDRKGVVSPIWDEPGTYGHPRMSPDGSRLSLSVFRDGNWDVWVFDLERDVATRLTFDEGYDGDQIWSPDGQHMVFTSDRGGKMMAYRKPADGSGEAELVAELEHDFWASSWSPDGKWIIGELQSESFGLWVVPADGEGEPFEYLSTQFIERFPDISPDGRWVAYMSNESGRPEIYVRAFPVASGKWQVSDGGGTMPTWSSDGSELFFRDRNGLMAAPVSSDGDTFNAGRPVEVSTSNFVPDRVGIVVAGSYFPDYGPMPDDSGFVVLFGDERRISQDHITLVTNWFGVLKETLPGS